MANISLKEKRKSRIGPKDFKRNTRARKYEDRANKFVFVSMLASIVITLIP